MAMLTMTTMLLWLAVPVAWLKAGPGLLWLAVPVPILLAGVGAALGVAGVRVAARRTLVQPVPTDPVRELRFVELAEADPGRVRAALARRLTLIPGSGGELDPTELVCSAGHRDRVDRALASGARGERTGEAVESAVESEAELASGAGDGGLGQDGEIWQLVGELAELAEDRRRFRGGSDWVADGDGVPSRRYQRPGWRRLGIFALLGATSGLVASLQAHPAAVAAVLTLGVAATVVACVDADTLLIDLATVATVGSVAVALAGWAAVAERGPGSLWSLLWVTVLVGGLFFGADRVFLRLRGVSGIGGGDLVIVPVAFGVPVLVAGQLLLVTPLLWVASMTAIGAHLVARFRHGAGREVPLAFGPHLMWAHLLVLPAGPWLLEALFRL
jgi:hypothetical protein